MKRSRTGISEDSRFTTDEIEVAGILILFCHYSKRLFFQWGSKRRRSTVGRDNCSATHNSKPSPLYVSASENDYELEHGIMAMAPPPLCRLPPTSSKLSALHISASENDYELEHGTMPVAPPPARHLPPTSCPNSKDVKPKNRPRKRAPKKKTHRELMESVRELSLENGRLIMEVGQMRKTNQDLKDCNVHMKSQLASCLQQREEQNKSYTSRSSSFNSDIKQKTETTASCDDFRKCNEHEHFEKCSGSSTLGSACDKPQMLGWPMYPCSSESSSGSEKNGAIPKKDTICLHFLDLNILDEALFGTSIFSWSS